jgi:excisionase family DNA binding protein
MIINDKIMNLDEACALLKISKPTLYRKVASGEIPAQKVGRSWRFLMSEMMNLVSTPLQKSGVQLSNLATPIDLSKIAQVCKKYYVGLCYLFGSFAAGSHDTMSDIDLGIVFLPNIDLDKRRFFFSDIQSDFANCVKKNELDLIFLQDVGPLVQEQAFLGDLIYSIDPSFRVEYEDHATRQAMDFRFFQRRFDQDMVEDIKEGCFFVT